MFGTNLLLPRVRDLADSAGTYWVQEVFPTLQGEGPFAGEPAIFVRMAGCNLRCHFCDTDFESSVWHPTPLELMLAIEKAHEAAPGARLVVFTGGEPLRQPLAAIMRMVSDAGYRVQVETAGAIWDDSISGYSGIAWVCSPKTGKVHKKIAEVCNDYKYIVRALDADPSDGLPVWSTQNRDERQHVYRPSIMATANIWIQPCEEYSHVVGWKNYMKYSHTVDAAMTKANVKHAIALCLKYGYRLSYQLHKVLGLP